MVATSTLKNKTSECTSAENYDRRYDHNYIEDGKPVTYCHVIVLFLVFGVFNVRLTMTSLHESRLQMTPRLFWACYQPYYCAASFSLFIGFLMRV